MRGASYTDDDLDYAIYCNCFNKIILYVLSDGYKLLLIKD